jgi:hypothetical protein
MHTLAVLLSLLSACNDRDRGDTDAAAHRLDGSARSDGGSIEPRLDSGSSFPDAGALPPAGECGAIEIASRVGASAATGTIAASSATAEIACGLGEHPAALVRWIAPSTASYVADTSGSDFDTLLAVRDGSCDGAELACNDDQIGLQSSLRFAAVAGRPYVFVVGAYSEGGAFQLNLAETRATEAGLCTDALDNDGDGSVDCGDPDCDGDAACEGGTMCGSRTCTPGFVCRDCPGVGPVCLREGMACGLPPV